MTFEDDFKFGTTMNYPFNILLTYHVSGYVLGITNQ